MHEKGDGESIGWRYGVVVVGGGGGSGGGGRGVRGCCCFGILCIFLIFKELKFNLLSLIYYF